MSFIHNSLISKMNCAITKTIFAAKLCIVIVMIRRSAISSDYFSRDFRHLGLKQLIATCYKSREADLFSRHDSDTAICLNYWGTVNEDNIPSDNEISHYNLIGDGDFRSWECIEILKMADIVVTNPPFSLFSEYVAQLIAYDKKFLIIGPTERHFLQRNFPSD